MKTRIQNLFIALVWLALPALVQAQVNYAVSGNTAYVTISPNASGDVVITNIYDGYPVTSIGGSAFAGYGITSVTIPNSVTSIGDYAFANTSLKSVTIPNSLASIGVGVFELCYSLTSVTIPNSVTNIGDNAFADCTSLTAITVDANNPAYRSVAGVLFDIGKDTLMQYPSGNTNRSYTIPGSVTSIGDFAFAYCSGLTSVTIPNSITSIGDSAFVFCTSLTSVTIPNSVTSIGQAVFYYDDILTSVYFTGNAPSPTNDSSVFGGDPATVYYLPGTTGWGAMFDGQPTAPWFLPNPLILNHSAGFGVQPGGFGFTISWATNVSVVVEAATNLANPVWIPVSANTLTGGTNYFSDPQWTNYPMRFYRAALAFTVGGTLTGLPAGDTVTLHDNGSDNLTLSNNGTFTFPTALPNGHAYSITVSGTSVPPPTTCTLTNGSGTISGANVTNVAVQCMTGAEACPALTGIMDEDMYNAAVSDGTAHGGVPAVMFTTVGGPFRVTAVGTCSENVALTYDYWAWIDITVGSNSCSSTSFPSGTRVIVFGAEVECGAPSYTY